MPEDHFKGHEQAIANLFATVGRIVAAAEAEALREAAVIVADCAAQGLGLDAAQRVLLREADRLALGGDERG